jgi:hypothetical protein
MIQPTRGARYEITVDGQPRSNRDRRETAIEAGELLARRNPNFQITGRDRITGAVEVVINSRFPAA